MSVEDQLGEETRKRPVRLSRSGLPNVDGADQEEEALEDEAASAPAEEDVWGGSGGQRVPISIVKAAAFVLPLVGFWLLWTVASRNPGDEFDPLNAPRVDLTKVGDLTPSGVAMAFLKAKSIDERLALTYRPSTAQEHARDFADEVLECPIEASSVKRMEPKEAMGQLKLHRFEVVMPNGGRRLLCVVETAEGMRVDWDAFARYGSADLGDEEQEQFGEATVRVFAKNSKYYNFGFANEKEWLSFELYNPDWEHAVYGYAKRGSTTAKILRSHIARAPKGGQRVTLRMRGDLAEPKHRQFVIDRVLAIGWVIGRGDFEWTWEKANKKAEDKVDAISLNEVSG